MTRNEAARLVQAGASNPRAVAQALVNAIDECRAEGGNERDDHAVFLILHQLAFILTGHDVACEPGLSDRYSKAYDAIIKE